uniref:Uncharacterized protein n=1 Tax=Rhizophora mucronata TaxID=61149 RepID=A0A2P2Q626_RHIMU
MMKKPIACKCYATSTQSLICPAYILQCMKINDSLCTHLIYKRKQQLPHTKVLEFQSGGLELRLHHQFSISFSYSVFFKIMLGEVEEGLMESKGDRVRLREMY